MLDVAGHGDNGFENPRRLKELREVGWAEASRCIEEGATKGKKLRVFKQSQSFTCAERQK
jgi:hypothetical protein